MMKEDEFDIPNFLVIDTRGRMFICNDFEETSGGVIINRAFQVFVVTPIGDNPYSIVCVATKGVDESKPLKVSDQLRFAVIKLEAIVPISHAVSTQFAKLLNLRKNNNE
jgi:hypothetical protein